MTNQTSGTDKTTDKTTGKAKTRRPSKSERTYVRRMKKAARDAGIAYRPEIK